MHFKEIALLFEKLENTSKQLEKIMLLRDFYNQYPKESPLIFDIIAGNYQRKIGKKSLGISTKTLLEVLHFVSKTSHTKLQKQFNEKGDIGAVSQESFTQSKQTSLQNSTLTLTSITKAFSTISNKTGSNSNKYKKEILSKLFISAQTKIEYKFLARLLIDDLRIGVSHGVLKEAIVNTFFPKIISLHYLCQNCNYINISTTTCFSCREKIDTKNQDSIVEKNFNIHECKTPQEIVGLEKFIPTRDDNEQLAYILRNTKQNEFIKSQTPRELYNSFLNSFEKHYNCLNSFQKIIDKIAKRLDNILNVEIIPHQPVLSMLGTRAKTITDSFSSTGTPALIDYKYDGLRVQIHNQKGEVTLFSRNLEDITKQFPEVVEYIKTNFSDCSFVLDSECVGYDKNKQTYLPFQILSRRILTKNVSSVSSISVVVKTFDILYFNNKTLIDYSYEKRREYMENLYIGRTLVQKEMLQMIN